MKKFRRLISLLLAACLLAGCLSMEVGAINEPSGFCGENAQWNYDASSKILTISGTGAIETHPWSAVIWPITITEYVEKVIIQPGVTSICMEAFANCKNLVSATIPNSVATIGNAAFLSCENLSAITIPNSVTTIEASAFSYCCSLTSITIPNSVTKIDGHVFSNCTALTSVVIPNGVTTIERDAFSGCTSLTSIFIPGSVTQIEEGAFSGVANEINVDSDNANYISENGVLYNKSKTELLAYPGRRIGDFVVPNGVTTICQFAFSQCKGLTSVVLPYSVTKIRDFAFSQAGLQSITIPNKTAYIALYAFVHTKNLTFYGVAGSSAEEYAGRFSSISFTVMENPVEPVEPEPQKPEFQDVSVDEYYYDAVQWAVENGVTLGTGNGKFSPHSPCTRAQAVTFLWRAFGSPEPKGGGQFVDVRFGEYYYKAVCWAVENKITMGTSVAIFSINNACTRAQIVTFLYRLAGSPSVSAGNSFNDVSPDQYYYNAIQWAAANHITSGTGNGKFSPNTPCTRAQIVTFLYRNLNKAPSEDNPPEETNPSSKSMYQTVLREVISEQNSNSSDYSFQDVAKGFYYDLDNDGIEELVVQHWLEEKDSDGYITPSLVVSAYTISNGECVALLENELVYHFVGGPRCSIGIVEDNGSCFLCLQSETGETGGDPIHRYGWLKLYSLNANILSISSEAEYSYYTKTTGGIDTQKSDAVIKGDTVPYSQYQALEKEVNAKTIITMDNGTPLNALLSLSR